jgi:hypothetical protein
LFSSSSVIGLLFVVCWHKDKARTLTVSGLYVNKLLGFTLTCSLAPSASINRRADVTLSSVVIVLTFSVGLSLGLVRLVILTPQFSAFSFLLWSSVYLLICLVLTLTSIWVFSVVFCGTSHYLVFSTNVAIIIPRLKHRFKMCARSKTYSR